jgi:hypothetical protein
MLITAGRRLQWRRQGRHEHGRPPERIRGRRRVRCSTGLKLGRRLARLARARGGRWRWLGHASGRRWRRRRGRRGRRQVTRQLGRRRRRNPDRERGRGL